MAIPSQFAKLNVHQSVFVANRQTQCPPNVLLLWYVSKYFAILLPMSRP